jgi:hypothetical protein
MVGGAVALAALALFAAPFLGSVASADAAPPATLAAPVAPGAPTGLRDEQRLRMQHQQEFLREHSDASGKIHPDAYVKGMEHARHMKVAPYIGAKPLGEASRTSPTSTK